MTDYESKEQSIQYEITIEALHDEIARLKAELETANVLAAERARKIVKLELAVNPRRLI